MVNVCVRKPWVIYVYIIITMAKATEATLSVVSSLPAAVIAPCARCTSHILYSYNRYLLYNVKSSCTTQIGVYCTEGRKYDKYFGSDAETRKRTNRLE